MSQQSEAFARSVEAILETVMFENWLRFYFISEKPGQEESLFLSVPVQGMEKIKELYPHLLALAENLNGKELTFEASRSAVCTHVVTELDGKRIPRNMADMVFDSATFHTEMQLFNTWVQAHEAQLDQNFMDFGTWRSLFGNWRRSDEVKDWALQMQAAALSAVDTGKDKGGETVQ